MRKADPKTMTKTERKHWGFGVDAIRMIEHELMGYLHETRALPRDWDKIWEEQDKRDLECQEVAEVLHVVMVLSAC